MKRVRWRAVIDRTATARIQRLLRWLEPFQRCFGHRAQRLALRTYVHGLFSDSDRKSMQAMLARVTQPVTYQAFQHFITHATWDADRIWRRLLEELPERHGVLIIDGTSFPKQGKHSVGVTRQYCGALGKIANCQVAVTAALWTGRRDAIKRLSGTPVSAAGAIESMRYTARNISHAVYWRPAPAY